MDLFKGIVCNLRGLILGLRTPRLFLVGMVRFLVTVGLAIFFSGLILFWHQELLNVVWTMPESGPILFLWKVVSWLLSLVLSAIAGLFSYILAQIFFSVFLMDIMSRITERMVTGVEVSPQDSSVLKLVFYLLMQEIPRAFIPLLAVAALITLGWLTPFGPAITVVSSIVATTFLAWDNTDLVAARRLDPFKIRFAEFKRNLLFHLGFGLWFLIPWVNIIFLSFAPVGGTLYAIQTRENNKNG
ncbi:MAG: EI24 domain-containing protein [Desulfobacterium sp.]|jgi:CysZ protein|nr:EI24 domain-containing protein [Desulfobacterium sp.]